MISSKYTYFAVFVLLWHHTCITESSENLARGKSTNQSSTYNSNFHSLHAVNGQTGCNHFAHTNFSKYEWWRVDLGDVYEIQKIQIYYRTGHIERLSNYSINISTSLDPLKTWLCFKDPGNVTLTDINPYKICPHLGRYVTFSRQQETGVKAVITLCELEVYGCPQGRYGNGDCNSNCSVGCLNSRCDPGNGHCNCSRDWTGDKCNNCSSGHYLHDEMCIPCPTACRNNNCKPDNGECTYRCYPPYYGTFCNLTCPTNCNISCARNSGHCIGCKTGFYGHRCEKVCQWNCKYKVCRKDDGYCISCNYPSTGNTCTECNDVSYSLGTICIPCSTGCRLNACNDGTGECLNGCNPPFYGTFCNLTCPTNCYNTSCARNSGKCFGCKEGSHGDKCEATCPSNCKNKVCRQDDGYCTSCKYPYTGITCTECNAVSYSLGAICIPCSTGCRFNSCNAGTGKCLNGCNLPFYGTFCNLTCPTNCYNASCARNRVCVVGLYGKDCDIACPVNCKHRMCDGTDGTCMFGCKYANMTGNQCDDLTATTGTDNLTNVYIGLIIVGIISSINTVFIVIILILYYKRRRRKETVYENQKAMGSPQTGTDQIDIHNPEQQQTVHYETLGLSDRGSINTNSADAYTGLNMIATRIHQNDNS